MAERSDVHRTCLVTRGDLIFVQKPDDDEEVRHLDVAPSALFFSFNKQLGPPYHIILDTNFINFSIQNKLDPMKVTPWQPCTPPHPRTALLLGQSWSSDASSTMKGTPF